MKISKFPRRLSRFGFALVALVVVFAIFARLTIPPAAGAWFDDTYAYRVKFTFTHNADIASERAVTFTLDTAELIAANLMQADCDDTKFTDAKGKPLLYDLTGTCNNAATTYEVIFPSIVNGSNLAYVYYANPGAVNGEIISTGYTALTPSGGDPSETAPTTNDEQGTSPISYWNLDEGYGTTANDYSTGSNNDLTIAAGSGSAGIEQQINIVNQYFNTNSTSPVPTDNSLGIIHWTAGSYTGATVYFEADITSLSISRSVTATLYTTAGAAVSGSAVTIASSTWARVRSSAITLTDNTDYTVRINMSNINDMAYIKSARLIVVQSNGTAINNTETQIEVGNPEGRNAGTYSTLASPKIYGYDSSKFTPAPTAYFEAQMRSAYPKLEQQINILDQQYTVSNTTDSPTDNSLGMIHWTAGSYTGATVYFEADMASNSSVRDVIATLYTAAGAAVSGSSITVTSTVGNTFYRVRSGAITLTDNTDYTVRIRTDSLNSLGTIKSARLIIVQSNATAINNTETQIEVGSPEGRNAGTYATLANPKIYGYDSSKFTPAPTAYFEAQMRSAYPKLEQQINILDKAYSTTSTTDVPTDNSLGLIRWTAGSYTGATVYFEADISSNSSVRYVQATLYTAGGSAVSGSGLFKEGVVGNDYFRIRSGSITLVDGTDYTVRILCESGGTCAIRGARLVIVQSNATAINDTETQIELGNNETSTATSDTQLTNKKIYRYDSSKFTPAPTAYFEATLSNDTGGQTAYASLYTDSSSCSSQLSGSEISVTGTTWTRVRSASVTLSSGTDYMVCVRASANTARIANAKIVLIQTDGTGITETELIHHQVNTLATDADSGYTFQNFINLSDPNRFGVYPEVYLEATMKTSAGTGYAQMYTAYSQLNTGAPITGSEITTTSTSYTRVRGSTDIASAIPQNPTEYDIVIRNSASNTTSVAGTSLVIYLNNIPTGGGGTGYAQLYNSTDTTAVSGSEVTTTNSAFTTVRSSAITLTTGKDYVVQTKSSFITNAKIILIQSDGTGITETELIHPLLNTLTTDGDSTYTYQGLIQYYDPLNFGVYPEVYLEATMKTSAGTGYAQIATTYPQLATGTAITNSEITTTSASYTRVRGSTDVASGMPLNPTEYDIQLKNSASNTTSVAGSSLIVYLNNIPTGGTGTGYAQLYNSTDTAAVSGSEVTTGSSTFTRVRSGAITLTTGKDYVVQIKSAIITNAKLILIQSDGAGITATELIHHHVNTSATDTDSTYTDQEFLNQFDPGNFTGSTLTHFFEATLKTSAGTGYAQLRNDTDGTAVTGSEVTTTSASYARVRSGDITANMPSATKNMDTQLKNSATNTTTASSTWLIIQISGLTTTTPAIPTWTTDDLCASGKCLSFINGIASKTYAADTELDPGTGSFTVAGWFKHTSNLTGTDTLVGRFASAGYKIYTSSSGMCFGIDDDSTSFPEDSACTTTTYADSIWHHIAAVKSSTSSITLYVDGKQVDKDSSLSATGSLSGSSPAFVVGNETATGSKPWLGFIDEVKYYSFAKSAPQIQAESLSRGTGKGNSAHFDPDTSRNLSSGLLGYWKLNESSGNAADSSGNNLTLTNNGTTTYNAAKFANGSEHVPASSQYLSTATTISGIKSVSFWTNPDSTTNYFISLTSTAYITALSGTLSATGFTNPKIYVNGIETTAISADAWQLVTITTNTAINADTFYVGRQGSNYFDGTLDEVRLYSRSLAPSEVEALYDWAPGPLAWYKLDDNSGTTPIDSSGNAAHGTFTGTPLWIPGKIGSALNFNGSSQAVTATLGTDPGYFNSVQLWVYPTSSAASKTLVTASKLTTNSSSQPVYGSCTGTAIPLNTWSHIAAVSTDSTHCTIYQNGVLTANSSTTGVTFGTAVNVASSSFAGNIDDVRIYNYARTQKQIIADSLGGRPLSLVTSGGPSTSQIAYWTLDEQQGQNLNSQNTLITLASFAGTSSSSEAADPTWKTESDCKINGCQDFDGATEVDTITNADAIDFDLGLNTGVTFSAWVNPDTVGEGTGGEIFRKSAATYCQLTGSSPFNLVCSLDLSTPATKTVSAVIPASTWTHVVMTWSDDADDEISVWINGVNRGSSTDGVGPPTADSSNLLIGGGTSNNFDGKIDEFKIYNFELSKSEILIDMNAGSSSAMGGVLGTHNQEGLSITAPILQWNFNENTGSTANDTSGNTNTGTITTNTPWVTGKINSALSFDGSSQSVTATITSLGNTNTLETWLYPTSSIASKNIITSGKLATDGSGQPTYGTCIGAAIPLNQWTHLVAISNGAGSCTIYQNGIQTASNTTGVTFGTSVNVAASSFSGIIDQVKIYNVALTQSQIAYDYNRGAPVTYYAFDDCQGTTAYNAALNSNGLAAGYNASISLGASPNIGDCQTASTAWGNGVTGKYTSSLDFDGSDDVATVTNADAIDFDAGLQNGFTISAWVNAGTAGESNVGQVFNKSADHYLRVDNPSGSNLDVEANFDLATTDANVNAGAAITTGTWNHLVMTSNGSTTVSLYVNGVAKGSSTGSGSRTADGNLLIGGSTAANFDGLIDEFKIFSYEMTAGQIRTLYNEGSAVRFGPQTGSP